MTAEQRSSIEGGEEIVEGPELALYYGTVRINSETDQTSFKCYVNCLGTGAGE